MRGNFRHCINSVRQDSQQNPLVRHRDPHLGLDGVFGGAEETLDAQVLLDRAKKQFHLPTAFVEGTEGERGQREVVGQKDPGLGGLGILEANAA